MSALSQVPPHMMIKPIPLELDRSPLCRTILSTIGTLFATTIFTLSVGTALAFAEIGVSLIAGILVSGSIGLILGIASSVLLGIHVSENIKKYRLATLDQIQKTHLKPQVLMAVRKLKEIFKNHILNFKQTSDNHALHYWTTIITKNFNRSRPDVKKVWKIFLKNMHKAEAYNPDGRKIYLDFSHELMRLEGQTLDLKTEYLDKSSPKFDEDLQRVEELQRESFGIETAVFRKHQLKEILLQDLRNQCIVVRRNDTNQIIGFAWCKIDKQLKGTVLMGIGREAGAAKYQIGKRLMSAFCQNLRPSSQVYLQVRVSNKVAWQHLYEPFGFEKVKVLSNYYPHPTEDAYLMKLNWEKFQKKNFQ